MAEAAGESAGIPKAEESPYAMSSINAGNYRVLSDSLVAAFRGTPQTTTLITMEEDTSGKGGDQKLTSVRPTALMTLRDPRPVDVGPEWRDMKFTSASEDTNTEGVGPDAGTGTDPGRAARAGSDPKYALFQMAHEVKRALQGLIDRDLVHARQTALAVEVEFKADIRFPSGVSVVAPAAVPVLTKVAEILKPFPTAIPVEAHTDNRSVSTSVFPSNWELSGARAANAVQLFTKAGVDPLRMQVLGLGEFRPVAANNSAEGRNPNRRVVIVVMEQPKPAGTTDPVDGALKDSSGVSSSTGPTVLVQRPGNHPTDTP